MADRQNSWRVGPVKARKLSHTGRVQYIGNVDEDILLRDTVIKFFPDHPKGPCFVLENRRDTTGVGDAN